MKTYLSKCLLSKKNTSKIVLLVLEINIYFIMLSSDTCLSLNDEVVFLWKPVSFFFFWLHSNLHTTVNWFAGMHFYLNPLHFILKSSFIFFQISDKFEGMYVTFITPVYSGYVHYGRAKKFCSEQSAFRLNIAL